MLQAYFINVMLKQTHIYISCVINCFANLIFMFLYFLLLVHSFLQKTKNFLPSYETVSFAVKSVFQEFNWTSAEILATGK